MTLCASSSVSMIFDALHCHLGVRFIYETVTPAPEAAAGLSFPELCAAIDTLPAAWVTNNLNEAITALDANQILALIEAIRPQAPHLADTLTQCAREFEYKKLIILIKGNT